MTTDRKTILTMAESIVSGDRERVYGHPAKNLETIAEMWTVWLRARGLITNEAASLSIDDVALMMVQLKLARLANDPWHLDSLTDLCGYARLMERCHDHMTDELRQPA